MRDPELEAAAQVGAGEVRVMVMLAQEPIIASAAATGMPHLPGFQWDSEFGSAAVPSRRTVAAAAAAGAFGGPRPDRYLLRGKVAGADLPDFLREARKTRTEVFTDPVIQPVAKSRRRTPDVTPPAGVPAVCPTGPVGTDADVAALLEVSELGRRGLDGAGVRVVVVDTGLNLEYLHRRGRSPAFDADLSWSPDPNVKPGATPLSSATFRHGTMCAYGLCIAAPACTLVDHAVLRTSATGLEGLLSDAIKSYSLLLEAQSAPPAPFAGDHLPRTLVVNNSWAMYHSSSDFPPGTPSNYSDNPDHPFNIILDSLEQAGADIVFAAGNCGAPCPDVRCGGITTAGIMGANSHPAALSVAGVLVTGERAGYSSVGPGRLAAEKPDVACFTHFAGSGLFAADGGTSTAAPVLAGVIAAVRRAYPASVLPPADLRDLIRRTANPLAGSAPGTYTPEAGFGVVNVRGLVAELDRRFGTGRRPGDRREPRSTTSPPTGRPK